MQCAVYKKLQRVKMKFSALILFLREREKEQKGVFVSCGFGGMEFEKYEFCPAQEIICIGDPPNIENKGN
jgi:hypothetical protein